MKSKNLFDPLIITVVMLFVCTGCKKEENKPENIVSDVEGNDYFTVVIGEQVWMAENLRTTKYSNGNIILNVSDNTQWSNLSDGALSNYENNDTYVRTYGGLYNWYVVNNVHKICPTGWHVPSDADWTELITFLGGENIAGGKLKETGETHWFGNISTNNDYGFSALPGGFRGENGFFGNMGDVGFWWSSSEVDSESAGYKSMVSWSDGIYSGTNSKKYGKSVRCIKDL